MNKKAEKSNKNKGKNMAGIFFKGMIMGIADVIPGVSGGTMALVMGIYERLIVAIGSIGNLNIKDIKQRGFFKSMINKNTKFLFALGLGIVVSILLLSTFITQVSIVEPVLFWSFFMGLVLASFMVILMQAKPLSVVKILLLVVSTGATIFLVHYLDLKPIELTPTFYFIAGAIASCAMILPGISGAFILLLLGVYFPVLEMLRNVSLQALSFFQGVPASEQFNEDLKNLAFLLAGILIGLLVFSRVLKLLLSLAKSYIMIILNGLILGTLDRLWPWKVAIQTRVSSTGVEVPLTYQNISPMYYEGDPRVIFAVVVLCAGMLIVMLADSYAKKKAKTEEQQVKKEGGEEYVSAYTPPFSEAISQDSMQNKQTGGLDEQNNIVEDSPVVEQPQHANLDDLKDSKQTGLFSNKDNAQQSSSQDNSVLEDKDPKHNQGSEPSA